MLWSKSVGAAVGRIFMSLFLLGLVLICPMPRLSLSPLCKYDIDMQHVPPRVL